MLLSAKRDVVSPIAKGVIMLLFVCFLLCGYAILSLGFDVFVLLLAIGMGSLMIIVYGLSNDAPVTSIIFWTFIGAVAMQVGYMIGIGMRWLFRSVRVASPPAAKATGVHERVV